MKRSILAIAFATLCSVFALPQQAVAVVAPSYSTPPINPFDANGFCFGSGCPKLLLGTTESSVSSLTGAPRFPMHGTVPTTIPLIFVGISNKGYSNWWDASAFLVSSNGTRIPLGAGKSDDGNDYEDIGIRCQPLYDLNYCYPSFAWENTQLPATSPVGAYALEIQFFLYDGRLDTVHTFGPNFMTVTGQVLPRTLDGKACKVAGKRQTLDDVRYACLKKGKRLAWQRLL